MPTAKGLADYCNGVDENDATLKLCLDAAVEYFKNAGVPTPLESSATYDLGIYMLAGTWFNARGTLAIGQVPAPLERTVQAIILQLR